MVMILGALNPPSCLLSTTMIMIHESEYDANNPELLTDDYLKELIPKLSLLFCGNNSTSAYCTWPLGLMPEMYQESDSTRDGNHGTRGEGLKSIPDIAKRVVDSIQNGGTQWKNKVGPFSATMVLKWITPTSLFLLLDGRVDGAGIITGAAVLASYVFVLKIPTVTNSFVGRHLKRGTGMSWITTATKGTPLSSLTESTCNRTGLHNGARFCL